MQSKYKTGLLRSNLLVAGALVALRAYTAETATETLVLYAMTAWLVITSMWLTTGHRRLVTRLWQLVPGVLLTALLCAAPEPHITWLWAWAILLMWPQPLWMLLLHTLLALTTWQTLYEVLGSEQWWLAGLILIGLMMLGLSRSRALQTRRFTTYQHARLVDGRPLWSRAKLEYDLERERRRATREAVHAELLLLRVSPRHLLPQANQLQHHLQRFEHSYRLDRHTLGVVLLSRNIDQLAQRRRRLLDAVQPQVTARAIPLPYLVSLTDEIRALPHQAAALWIKERSPHA